MIWIISLLFIFTKGKNHIPASVRALKFDIITSYNWKAFDKFN